MTEGGRSRPLRCHIGLHNWSTNRGGIRVCERDGCRKATTYGATGAMRRIEWERELYDEFQRYRDKEAKQDA